MTNVDALMIGSVVAIAFFESGRSFSALLGYRPTLVRSIAVVLIWTLMVLDHFVSGAVSAVAFSCTVTSLAGAYLIVSYASISGGVVHAFLNWRPVRYVGVLSYSLYIWQQPFLNSYNSYGYLSPPAVLRFPTNVVVSLAVAALSYHALERPVLSLRKRFRQMEAQQPTTAAN
jgi:peptidoglycan/LPS O-acetylase OafA/YrhL